MDCVTTFAERYREVSPITDRDMPLLALGLHSDGCRKRRGPRCCDGRHPQRAGGLDARAGGKLSTPHRPSETLLVVDDGDEGVLSGPSSNTSTIKRSGSTSRSSRSTGTHSPVLVRRVRGARGSESVVQRAWPHHGPPGPPHPTVPAPISGPRWFPSIPSVDAVPRSPRPSTGTARAESSGSSGATASAYEAAIATRERPPRRRPTTPRATAPDPAAPAWPGPGRWPVRPSRPETSPRRHGLVRPHRAPAESGWLHRVTRPDPLPAHATLCSSSRIPAAATPAAAAPRTMSRIGEVERRYSYAARTRPLTSTC